MAFLLSKTLSLNVELQIGMKWKGESSQEEACINQLWCQTHMYKHPHAHSEVQREDVIVPLRGLILWNHKSNTLWCNYLLALIQKLKSDPAINTLINDLFMKQHELTCFLFFLLCVVKWTGILHHLGTVTLAILMLSKQTIAIPIYGKIIPKTQTTKSNSMVLTVDSVTIFMVWIFQDMWRLLCNKISVFLCIFSDGSQKFWDHEKGANGVTSILWNHLILLKCKLGIYSK